MWSDEDGPYDGKHYQLAETICVPQPIQQPRPPILIGGSGEKKTLRLVAKYADACNLFGTDVAMVRHKLEVLRMHCDNEGADYDAIEKTLQGRGDPIGEPDAFLRNMEEYAALGIDLVELNPPAPDPVGFVNELSEEIIPRLAELESVSS
jgi:alkanesulfonate monooxygenase SsuD/methylene tetrahydromethanopterin reductase-like flavin-dependent oxidoreductase (luciferase family)